MVLTAAQQKILKGQFSAIRAAKDDGQPVSDKQRASEALRDHVHTIGLLEGKTLVAETLAELIRTVRLVQNLNPIQLPNLMGTYSYYRFFKGFEGSPEEFSEHMAAKRPKWEPGSIGYDGADLAKLSEALRVVLTASGDELVGGLTRAFMLEGLGRAFLSGVMFLYEPKKWALVNSAAIAPFKSHGACPITNKQMRELRTAALTRHGITQAKVPKKVRDLLAWNELFGEVANEHDLADFMEVDWLLWRLSKMGGGGGGGKRKKKVQPAIDVSEAIDSILAEADNERLEVRKAAEGKASTILARSQAELKESALQEVLRLLNVDRVNGRDLANRYSPAFTGQWANNLLGAVGLLGELLPHLWSGTPDEIGPLLDEFWGADHLTGAEAWFPTAILYLRDPENYSLLQPGMLAGLKKLTGFSAKRGRSWAKYKRYNQAVQLLRKAHSIPAEAIDIVLFRARKLKSADMGAGKVKVSAFGGFNEDTFRFFEELRENNTTDWYKENRRRFHNNVSQPLRGLFKELCGQFFSQVPEELETEVKSPRTISRIRKNTFGNVKIGGYWDFLWAATFRVERTKATDIQLYTSVHGDHVAYGMSFVAAPEDVRGTFVKALTEHRALADEILAELAGIGFVTNLDAGDGTSQHREAMNAEALAALMGEGSVSIERRHAPDEEVVRGPALVDVALEGFRKLYELYLFGIAEDARIAVSEYRGATVEKSELEDDDVEPEYTLDGLCGDTFLEQDFFDELERLLEDKGQVILHGPPGTGKTYVAELFARYFCGASGETKTIQFHPSYGYEEFVEGIRPTVDAQTGNPVFRVEPGIFRRFCDEARKNRGARYVLIVDEINRGNLPRIFGELLYLLEKRTQRVELPYSKKPFSIPQNVYVIGTMNSADRSIALVDLALRRRFHFKEFEPRADILRSYLEQNCEEMAWVGKLLQDLNLALQKEQIEKDLYIGHSHFMKNDLDDEWLKLIWSHTIHPILEEYFYSSPERLKRFSFDKLVAQASEDPESSAVGAQAQVAEMGDEEMDEALMEDADDDDDLELDETDDGLADEGPLGG